MYMDGYEWMNVSKILDMNEVIGVWMSMCKFFNIMWKIEYEMDNMNVYIEICEIFNHEWEFWIWKVEIWNSECEWWSMYGISLNCEWMGKLIWMMTHNVIFVFGIGIHKKKSE